MMNFVTIYFLVHTFLHTSLPKVRKTICLEDVRSSSVLLGPARSSSVLLGPACVGV